MAGQVLDYANWRPAGGAGQIKAAGAVGVVRYIMPARFQWPKALTPLELLDLAGHGLGVAFNFERNTGDYRGGYAAGAANGALAQEAMHELSQNDPYVPVYVSIDTDVEGAANIALAGQYVAGFYSTCKHLGHAVYGEPAVIVAGAAQYGWATNATAWAGDTRAHIVLRQYFNKKLPGLPGDYDVNDALAADWGQIPRPSAPPPSPGAFGVQPQFNPPKSYAFVSRLEIHGVGAWDLLPDWGVITLAGPFGGTMHGNAAVQGRTPALIVPTGTLVSGAHPPLAAYPPNHSPYECIATSGERYLPTVP